MSVEQWMEERVITLDRKTDSVIIGFLTNYRSSCPAGLKSSIP